MMMLHSFFILFLTASVFCDGDSFLDPCSVKDIDCLSKSTEKFLEKTAPGIPEYGFKAIDPLIIPSLDVEVDENMGLVFHFKELNITGLKKQSISDFRMDTDAKSVVLKTRADLHLAALLNIELTKDSKSFTGLTTIDSTVFGTAQYNYELKPNDKGVEFFDVGPETISCEITEEPNIILEAHLNHLIESDPDAQRLKADYLANRVAYRKKVMCAVTKRIYEDVVYNIRAAAKILPKTAFFKDV